MLDEFCFPYYPIAFLLNIFLVKSPNFLAGLISFGASLLGVIAISFGSSAFGVMTLLIFFLDFLIPGIIFSSKISVIWLVFLWMAPARPKARGRNLFSFWPSSTKIFAIYRFSEDKLKLFAAEDTADFKSFKIGKAAFLL